MNWNFDISQAPRGKYVTQVRHGAKCDFEQEVFVHDPVILASKCEKVIKSRWLGDADHPRWEFFKAGEQPVAWQPWPDHPIPRSAPVPPGAADRPSEVCSSPSLLGLPLSSIGADA